MGRSDAPWAQAIPDGARQHPMGRGDTRWDEATRDGARRRPMGRGDARWGEATPDGGGETPDGERGGSMGTNIFIYKICPGAYILWWLFGGEVT